MTTKKCISVALVGAPNAGKSTLLNNLIGEKISIVSPKAQTTRDIIRGILVQDNAQIIFVDTPGVFVPKKTRMLERRIVKTAWTGIMDADVICLMVDTKDGFDRKVRTILTDLKKRDLRIVLVLNKVDLVHKPKLLEITKQMMDFYSKFEKVFMISATKGRGVEDLRNYLIEIAPESEWVYPKDEITDAPLKFLASEITREQLFLNLKQELPYSVHVETESWKQLKDKSIKINQVIYVFKKGQKSIILGKKGSMIKRINIEARKEMEKCIGSKVHLYLFVKVKEDWVEERWRG